MSYISMSMTHKHLQQQQQQQIYSNVINYFLMDFKQELNKSYHEAKD